MDYIAFYDRNSTLKSTVLRSFDSKIFSLGTDFKFLAHLTGQGELETVKEYLGALAKFAEYMAGVNFPLLINTNGVLANSAASIFTSLPFVYCQGSTRLQFNDINFQSTPTGGSTFALSRLPSGLGAYLMLTGNPISGEDLQKLGFVKDFLLLDKENLEYIKNYSARNYEVNEFVEDYKPLFGTKLSQKADVNLSIKEFFDRSRTENGRQVLFDLFYRRKLIETANYSLRENMTDPESWVHHNDDYFSTVENYITCFENDVLLGLPYTLTPDPIRITEETYQFMSRVFVWPTLSEVYEALDRENSAVARTIKSELEQKNQVVLALTLKMVNEARNKSFNECLLTEYETALSLASNPKTKHFAFKSTSEKFEEENRQATFLFSKSQHNDNFDSANPYFLLLGASGKGAEVLSSAERLAEAVFRDSGPSSLALGLTASALLPTKDYYRRFPEAFRCFFNNQPLQNSLLEKNFKQVVQTFLIRYGIDYLNPTFDKVFTLERLRLHFDWQRKLEIKGRRALELAQDRAKFNRYISEREDVIQAFINDEDFEKKLNDLIEQVFIDEIFANDEMAISSANRARLLMKAEPIRRLADHVITHRLTEAHGEQSLTDLLRDLPLEITNNRFKLSAKTKHNIKFDELQSKYKLKLKLKHPSDIKDALEYGIEGFSEYFELKASENPEIVIDEHKIFEIRDNYLIDRFQFDPRRSEFRAMCLYLFETPRAELSYRAQFIRETLDRIKQANVELSEEAKLEIINMISEKFFIDYKDTHVMHDILLFSRDNFLDFCAMIRPSYQTVTLGTLPARRPPGIVSEPFAQETLDRQKAQIDALKKLNSLDLNTTSKVEPVKSKVTSSLEDLLVLIYETSILPESQKAFLKSLEKPKGLKLFDSVIETMHQIYANKLCELFGDEPIDFAQESSQGASSLSALFRGHAVREAREEFAAFLAPHLFYNLSERLIEQLDELYTNLNDSLHSLTTNNQRKNFDNIKSALNKLDLQFNNEEELNQLLNSLDDLLSFAVDLNARFRSTVFFKEDLLRLLAQKGKEILRVKLLVTRKFTSKLQEQITPKARAGGRKLKRKKKLEAAKQPKKISKKAKKKLVEKEDEDKSKAKNKTKLQDALRQQDRKGRKSLAPEVLAFNENAPAKPTQNIKNNKNQAKQLNKTNEPPKPTFELGVDKLRQEVKNMQDIPEPERFPFNYFDTAGIEGEINPTDFASFEALFNQFFQRATTERYEEGFEGSEPLLTPLKRRLPQDTSNAFFNSPDEKSEKFLRFDAFLLGLDNSSQNNLTPNQMKALRDINNFVEEGRLARLLSRAGKLKASLVSQLYGGGAGPGFERGVRANFLQAYYDSHRVDPELSAFLSQTDESISYQSSRTKRQFNALLGATKPENFGALGLKQRQLVAGAFRTVLDLEAQARRLAQGGLPSGCEDFYYQLSRKTVEIPIAFNEMDYRQSASDWLGLQLYTYLKVVFSLRKNLERKQNDLQLKLADFDVLPLLKPDKIRQHLRDKLYQEVLMLETHGFTHEEWENGFEARLNAARKTSPEQLDASRVLEDESRLKQYIAFEAFAFKDRGQSNIEMLRDIRYLTKLGREIGEKKKEPIYNAIKETKVEVGAEEEPMNSDPVYAQIFRALDDRKNETTDALKKDLSKSIHHVASRLSLYK